MIYIYIYTKFGSGGFHDNVKKLSGVFVLYLAFFSRYLMTYSLGTVVVIVRDFSGLLGNFNLHWRTKDE